MRPLVEEGEEVDNYQSDTRVAKRFIGNAKKWVLNTQIMERPGASKQGEDVDRLAVGSVRLSCQDGGK